MQSPNPVNLYQLQNDGLREAERLQASGFRGEVHASPRAGHTLPAEFVYVPGRGFLVALSRFALVGGYYPHARTVPQAAAQHVLKSRAP